MRPCGCSVPGGRRHRPGDALPRAPRSRRRAPARCYGGQIETAVPTTVDRGLRELEDSSPIPIEGEVPEDPRTSALSPGADVFGVGGIDHVLDRSPHLVDLRRDDERMFIRHQEVPDTGGVGHDQRFASCERVEIRLLASTPRRGREQWHDDCLRVRLEPNELFGIDRPDFETGTRLRRRTFGTRSVRVYRGLPWPGSVGHSPEAGLHRRTNTRGPGLAVRGRSRCGSRGKGSPQPSQERRPNAAESWFVLLPRRRDKRRGLRRADGCRDEPTQVSKVPDRCP